MIEPVWWIREIDWRISSGIIFFIQLLIWNNTETDAEKKSYWPVRIAISGIVMCAVSWLMRYGLETLICGKTVQALGYSGYLLMLTLLFIGGSVFCYRIPWDTVIYNSMIVLMVYRMEWNIVKLISAVPVGAEAAWTKGSPIQSLLSYAFYIAFGIASCKLFRSLVKCQVTFSLKWIGSLFGLMLFSQMLLEFTYQIADMQYGGMYVLYFLTALVYCIVNGIFLVLGGLLSSVQMENLSMQNFIQSRKQYYEVSQKGILSLQIKCHDLKHQISLIRSAEGQQQFAEHLAKLSDTIDEYNTVVDSGNKNVDVVLTEKNIICSANGVRFTYIIDGTLFDFLSEMEIYSLFGNIMDNALEGMEHVACPEKRFISLKAARRGDMVVLSEENYLEGALEFKDGIPMTTKKEKTQHGFGIRSIMHIVHAYHGNVSIRAKNGTFRLTIFMYPGKKKESAE